MDGLKQASKQLCEEKVTSFICYPCSMLSKVMVGMNDLVDSLPPEWESQQSQMLKKNLGKNADRCEDKSIYIE